MKTPTQIDVQQTVKSVSTKKAGRVPSFDVGKVKIVQLPRRNDDIYMRTVRRHRA